jgi:hypothetical protein
MKEIAALEATRYYECINWLKYLLDTRFLWDVALTLSEVPRNENLYLLAEQWMKPLWHAPCCGFFANVLSMVFHATVFITIVMTFAQFCVKPLHLSTLLGHDQVIIQGHRIRHWTLLLVWIHPSDIFEFLFTLYCRLSSLTCKLEHYFTIKIKFAVKF